VIYRQGSVYESEKIAGYIDMSVSRDFMFFKRKDDGWAELMCLRETQAVYSMENINKPIPYLSINGGEVLADRKAETII